MDTTKEKTSTLAIEGGVKTKSNSFPKWPFSGPRELELVAEVVRSQNWWRMTGTKVSDFEEKFARYHDVKYCLGVTNGTHAIELALAALGIGKDDEVLVPAFTFVSTGTAVLYNNATPVFVDCDPNTFCMDVHAIESLITERTKAIIPVHMAGHVCDMDRIGAIARKHGLKVIEDAAHAHGAEWKNKKVGAFGDFAIFSFQNGKIMTSGEGGALVTNNQELFDKVYLIHGVGRPKNDRTYQHMELGSNYRMNEFQGAILIAQLERLAECNTTRQRNATLLNSLLSGVAGITPQRYEAEVTANTHYMYMFYYDKSYFGGLDRMAFVDALIAEGIPAFIAYPLIHQTPFYTQRNFRTHAPHETAPPALPHAQRIADTVVWLPHFTLLGDAADTEDIANAILKIKHRYS
jgi:3-amino-5-hydroxybenzoate synthase